MGQLQGKENLREFVSLGRKLVRHFARRREFALFEFIEQARGEQEAGDASPIGGAKFSCHIHQ
jgi:hypothetical protein